MPGFYNRHPNPMPQFSEDEYLVYRGVNADDYRVLAPFGRDEYTQNHLYSLRSLTDLTSLNDILQQIYIYTGVWNLDILEKMLGKIFSNGFITRLQSAAMFVTPIHKFSKTEVLTIFQGFKKQRRKRLQVGAAKGIFLE